MNGTKKKSPFYLVTGLVIGIIVGLIIGWLKPVSYFDIAPVSLHQSFKEDYFVLAAQAWDADQDVGRAWSRLNELIKPLTEEALDDMLMATDIRQDYREDRDTVNRFVSALKNYMHNHAPSGN